MATTPMIAPDGRSGEIPNERLADAKKAGFKPAVAMIAPNGKLGYLPADREMDAAAAGFRPYDKPNVKMKTSAAPEIVRGATAALPAVGAMGGSAIAAPGIVTTAAGAGLGAAAGEQARLAANRSIFGPDETSPVSIPGLVSTGKQAAIAALPTAALDVAGRAVMAAPMTTGLRASEPAFGAEPITGESLAGQRAANAREWAKEGKPVPITQSPNWNRMKQFYRIAAPDARPVVSLPEGATTSGGTRPMMAAPDVQPSESATTSTGRNVQFATKPTGPAAVKTTKVPAVSVIPEPRPEFPGENPGYMSSVPRSRLVEQANAGKPGAGTMLQNLGKTVIYAPPTGYPGPRVTIAAPTEEPAGIAAPKFDEDEEELPSIRNKAAD